MHFSGLDQKENEADELDPPIFSSDLLNIMEESILTFLLFVKTNKKKSVSSLNLFEGHNQDESSLQQVKASLEKVCSINWSISILLVKCP